MRGDVGQRAAGVEGAMKHDEAAFFKCREREHIEAADMKNRRGGQRDVIELQIGAEQLIDVVPPEIAMGEHGAFWPPGGARGVHDHRHVVFVGREFLDGRRRRLRPFGLGLGGEPGFQRRQPFAHRRNRRGEMRIDDQRGSGAILDHEGQFGPGEAEVERHEDRAKPGGREQYEKEHRLVEAEKGDPFAASHAERRQTRGAKLDFRLHLGIGPRASLEMKGLARRRARGAT